MSRILLRTMTEKSIIQGGKDAGSTVGDLLQRSKISLIYIYFHYGLLTFTDDILDKLHIKPEDRISKPGTNPDLYHKYQCRNISIAAKVEGDKLGVGTGAMVNGKRRQKAKSHYKGLIQREKITFARQSLAWKNQGH